MSCFVTCDPNKVIPINYLANIADGVITRKNAGHTNFAFIRKGVIPTDIASLPDWQTLIDNDDIKLGPCGSIDLGTPSFNTDTDGCGNDVVDETIYTPTFLTKEVLRDTLGHVKYYIELVGSASCFNLILFDCYGNPILSPEATKYLHGVTGYTSSPTTSPGLEFTIPQNPHPTPGNNNKEQWNMQFQVKLDGEEIIGHSLVPGLYDALIAADIAP